MEVYNHKDIDAIVVGTGPGGATVARELSRKNKKVLMLELGGTPEIRGDIRLPLKGLRSHTSDGKITISRGITTGGSSMFFSATAFDPPYDMLESHDIDIRAEIEEAKDELPIAPISDDLLGPMSGRIMESALDLGYDWQKMPKFIYQHKCRSGCHRCLYGCPYGAKWNARMFVEEVVDKGGILVDRAGVNRIIIEGEKAVGVEYTRQKKKLRALAPLIVVSAGGIGTTFILRETGIHEAGYDFFIDPLVMVCGTVDDIKGGHELPMQAGMHMESDRYIMTDHTLPKLLYAAFAAASGRIDRLFSHSHALTIMVKAKDELSGKLIDPKKISKGLTEKDAEALEFGYEKARAILEHAGARKIFKMAVTGAHPGGTAKIGEVVDPNLKTRFENLYVCDASVIPTEFGLPPTLTLIGLGKRLAKYLTRSGNC